VPLVIRSPTTRARLVLVVLINLLCSVVCYHLSLNLKTDGPLCQRALQLSVVQMPAYLLTALFIDCFARKPLGVGMMLLSGIACAARSLLASVEFRAVRMA
jgi:MFS transporter, OCT family, solute carrier family 22 (organic cation transporter), member 4/5